MRGTTEGTEGIVQAVVKLGLHWPTLDPFLFCAHHHDRYPAGNQNLGIDRDQLIGRNIGSDFTTKDGFRMYHGSEVPGFPRHPHRGFETVTLARHGFIDHSDSMGAKARFGAGDVQWMTAGSGVVHCEMFPLVNREAENPAELFQIWLNLPAKNKMVPPYFTMFWANEVPLTTVADAAGRKTEVLTIAGQLDAKPPAPPPDSWAADPAHRIQIWRIAMEPFAEFTLSAASEGDGRVVYIYDGAGVTVAGTTVDNNHGVQLNPTAHATLINGDKRSEMLLLSGQPIGEPVAQHGPFVMNNRAELQQAFTDYQRTGFGGWPWEADDPVHGAEAGRFAIHADGRKERPS